LLGQIKAPRITGVAAGYVIRSNLETVIVNRRLATTAALFREVAIPASVLTWLVAVGSAGIDHTSATPIVDSLTPSLAADASFAGRPSPADVVTAEKSATTVMETADTAAVTSKPAPIVIAALTDPSETLRPETPPESAVKAAPEADEANRTIDPAEVDECIVVDPCIDRYLWALYQRTPKEDTVKSQEQRKVTVKKKGKLVTVTRSFTKLSDEDFSWKDPKAAEHAGMSMMDYVIGGMDRDFKLRLFQMLYAAKAAGLSPGITSAFRDNYRQSIASGLKAADDRSYHGGSLRGGYGHGLAADIVSVNGATRAQRLASTETFWKWVDGHGKEFGIGRPYLDRDPPHVGPIDGKEYVSRRGVGVKARQAGSAAKQNKVAMPAVGKRAKTARSSTARTT
jgi:LAS superfamily LD-carboxypeptidase LdcB